MSSFAALNTAYTGVSAAQLGIDTTSHNVSNANTEGYTRQRIDQVSRLPVRKPEGFVGTGTEILDVRRARDQFLDARLRTATVTLGSLESNARLLTRAESALGEPDDGITVVLDELFAAFEEVAISPADDAARVSLVSTLGRFADRVRTVAADLTSLEGDTAENLSYAVGDVNQALREVADLNEQILEAAASGRTPNDLLDQRDLLLDELATTAGVNVVAQGEFGVRVSIDGMGVVDGNRVSELTLDPLTYDITHPTGVALNPGGELGGIRQFLLADLPTLRTRLDAFVTDIVDAVNTQHAAGFADTGVAGGTVFTATVGAEAETLQSVLTDPVDVAASDADGTPFPVFNGRNAQALADLRNALVANGGSDTPGGSIRSLVTELGATVRTATRAAEAQDELVAAAELSRTEAHGVSLDEEMVLLIQFQRSYQAAARVMTTVDQTLDTLINRTGLVGR